MEDLDKRLAALLMANAKKGVKLYTTPCILAELEKIGPEYAGALYRLCFLAPPKHHQADTAFLRGIAGQIRV